MYSLRDYQQDLIDGVYKNFRAGLTRAIAWLQTGGGKTICFCKMTEEALNHGLPVVIVMRRRELIHQTSKKLDEFGISHGVYMANHPRRRPNELVQVCSIDTLAAREMYPHEDKRNKLIIIDESHDCTPRARKYANLIERYKNDFIVGFTATPFSDNSLFNSIVKPIEAHELRDRGFLVPDRTFVPNIIDTSSVSIKRNGEFNEHELFEASSKSEIIGDFVRDWKNYAQGRPTILFAVNVEHSKIISEAFNDAGIRAIHSDGTTNSNKRKRAIDQLVSGEVQVLTNVNIFSTGLDVPEVACVQLCRPTQSVIWHLQAIGRGLRTSHHTGKENCIIIDNAGNTLRHGTAYKVREAELGKRKKSSPVTTEDGDIAIRRCNRCNFVFEASIQQCPDCGFVNPKKERKIHHSDGELIELQISEEERQMLVKRNFTSDYYKLKFVAQKRNIGENPMSWVHDKLEEKYGLTVCKQYGNIINMEF